MTRPHLHLSIRLAALALTLLAARPVGAVVGECMIALDNETLASLAGENVIEVRDAVFHELRSIDMGDKTLLTIRPGDVVLSHGSPHILLEVNQRTLRTEYIFIDRSDLVRFEELLAGIGDGDGGGHHHHGHGDSDSGSDSD